MADHDSVLTQWEKLVPIFFKVVKCLKIDFFQSVSNKKMCFWNDVAQWYISLEALRWF